MLWAWGGPLKSWQEQHPDSWQQPLSTCPDTARLEAATGPSVFPGAPGTPVKSFKILWINGRIHYLDFEECTQKVQDSRINEDEIANLNTSLVKEV